MEIDIINSFGKNFFIIFLTLYDTKKLINIKEKSKMTMFRDSIVSILFSAIFVILKQYINVLFIYFITFILINIYLNLILKRQVLLSIIVAFAINLIFLLFSVMITYPIINVINLKIELLNVFIIGILQILINIIFFNIKRFKNGFNFLKLNLNKYLSK